MDAKMLVVLVVAVAGALADNPPPYKTPGMPYGYAYAVNNDYAGVDFGHEENSDGNNVKGTHYVQLPDGRRQTVTYRADHQNGFVADVSYYGEAQYPHEYAPPFIVKAPSYRPQPAGYP